MHGPPLPDRLGLRWMLITSTRNKGSTWCLSNTIVARPPEPGFMKRTDAILDSWLGAGLIQYSTWSSSSPVVYIPKNYAPFTSSQFTKHSNLPPKFFISPFSVFARPSILSTTVRLFSFFLVLGFYTSIRPRFNLQNSWLSVLAYLKAPVAPPPVLSGLFPWWRPA